MERGYQLPFYADLSRMPEEERRVIWGMMVGEEAKTKIPIFQNYTERGFDPKSICSKAMEQAGSPPASWSRNGSSSARQGTDA